METVAEARRTPAQTVAHLVRGPRLQVLNLAVFYTVVFTTIADYPNPIAWVALSVALSATLDAAALRLRLGEWRIPWGSIVATMGIWLLLDGNGMWPYLVLPVIVVASKHLVRTKSGHLFNANNLAACVLIVVGLARVGVNDWGGAPQAFALMVLFGTIACLRAKRFGVALMTLAFAAAIYAGLVAGHGITGREGVATWVALFLRPVFVMMAFFAVTDPATSPNRLRDQALYALLFVLVSVPATLAGRPDAAVFALLLVAPQRHAIRWLSARFAGMRGARTPGDASA